MKRKGFTTIELIVTFALTVMIMGFLFEVVLNIRDLHLSAGFKTELLQKQATLSRRMNRELGMKTIVDITNCGNECIVISFTDGSSSRLSIDREKKIFEYGDYKTEIITNSQFGNTVVDTHRQNDVLTGKANAILQIKIPIHHDLYRDDDFGINLIYQYDDRIYSIPPFHFAD